jgi:hypothetical protein
VEKPEVNQPVKNLPNPNENQKGPPLAGLRISQAKQIQSTPRPPTQHSFPIKLIYQDSLLEAESRNT